MLRAFHLAADASRRQLGGDHAGALRQLAAVEADAGLDVPRLGYEVTRVRARAYAGLGRPETAAARYSYARTAIRSPSPPFDTSPAHPHRREPDTDGGRDLIIIEALCAQWGVDHHDNCKHVWATFTLLDP